MPSKRIQRRIDGLLDEADAAFGSRDWPKLRELASDVLSLDSENADARTFFEAAGRNRRPEPAQSNVPTPQSKIEPLPASFVAGRYRVLRLLGQGGRKKVYLAHDERLGREVAFAVIPMPLSRVGSWPITNLPPSNSPEELRQRSTLRPERGIST